MSQALPVGWTVAFAAGVSSPDDATVHETIGIPPRRWFRVSEAATHLRRERGNRRSALSRGLLRKLAALDTEEP